MTDTDPFAEHAARPFHPSTNLVEHLRAGHGIDPPSAASEHLVAWHRDSHPNRPDSDSQLDADTAPDDVTVTRTPITTQELADVVGDPLDDPDRTPTDPAFRRRRTPTPKATPDDDTTRPPRLGATVLYRSRTGTYTMPALISATTASLYQPNVDAGHVAPLSSDTNVHLGVITCGIPGHVSARTLDQHPELADTDRPNMPAGGTFAEWDIPFWDPRTATGDGQLDAWLDGDLTAQPAGTWTWPVDA